MITGLKSLVDWVQHLPEWLQPGEQTEVAPPSGIGSGAARRLQKRTKNGAQPVIKRDSCSTRAVTRLSNGRVWVSRGVNENVIQPAANHTRSCTTRTVTRLSEALSMFSERVVQPAAECRLACSEWATTQADRANRTCEEWFATKAGQVKRRIVQPIVSGGSTCATRTVALLTNTRDGINQGVVQPLAKTGSACVNGVVIAKNAIGTGVVRGGRACVEGLTATRNVIDLSTIVLVTLTRHVIDDRATQIRTAQIMTAVFLYWYEFIGLGFSVFTIAIGYTPEIIESNLATGIVRGVRENVVEPTTNKATSLVRGVRRNVIEPTVSAVGAIRRGYNTAQEGINNAIVFVTPIMRNVRDDRATQIRIAHVAAVFVLYWYDFMGLFSTVCALSLQGAPQLMRSPQAAEAGVILRAGMLAAPENFFEGVLEEGLLTIGMERTPPAGQAGNVAPQADNVHPLMQRAVTHIGNGVLRAFDLQRVPQAAPAAAAPVVLGAAQGVANAGVQPRTWRNTAINVMNSFSHLIGRDFAQGVVRTIKSNCLVETIHQHSDSNSTYIRVGHVAVVFFLCWHQFIGLNTGVCTIALGYLPQIIASNLATGALRRGRQILGLTTIQPTFNILAPSAKQTGVMIGTASLFSPSLAVFMTAGAVGAYSLQRIGERFVESILYTTGADGQRQILRVSATRLAQLAPIVSNNDPSQVMEVNVPEALLQHLVIQPGAESLAPVPLPLNASTMARWLHGMHTSGISYLRSNAESISSGTLRAGLRLLNMQVIYPVGSRDANQPGIVRIGNFLPQATVSNAAESLALTMMARLNVRPIPQERQVNSMSSMVVNGISDAAAAIPRGLGALGARPLLTAIRPEGVQGRVHVAPPAAQARGGNNNAFIELCTTIFNFIANCFRWIVDTFRNL